MRSRLYAAVLVCGLATTAFADTNPCPEGAGASETDSFGPIKFKVSHVTVAMHRGRGGMLSSGLNDIDAPLKLNCANPSGCFLTAQANIDSSVAGFFVCIYADGGLLHPKSDNNDHVVQQGRRLEAGPHSVQTKVYSNPGTLGPWSVLYTMYGQ